MSYLREELSTCTRILFDTGIIKLLLSLTDKLVAVFLFVENQQV